jgi:transposase
MNFKEFIGIDVSKSHIDVFLYRQSLYAKFNNDEAGFDKMIKWIGQHMNRVAKDVLFVFEHTGLYSLPLSLYLHKRQYRFTLLSGLELKRSMGIAR